MTRSHYLSVCKASTSETIRKKQTTCSRVYLTAFAALTFSLLAGQSAYAGSTPNFPVPKDFFGMHLITKENWPTVPIGALGAGTLVRWIYIERSKGVYDWSLLDAWVMTAQQHGVSFHYTNDGVPAWAVADRSTCAPSSIDSVLDCNAPPMNIQDWDDFVTALVTRYKGKITYYELWNEPDNQYWLAGAKSHTKPGAMKTSDMVMLTKHAHDIIRRIDPNAKIISPSFHGSGEWFMDQYYAAGGVTDVDIVSIHGYPESGKITPEGSISNHVNRLLPIISKYGLQNKPLWDTEIAWSDQSNNAITDPDEQSAFVARSLLLHWSRGLTRIYWYAWDHGANIGTLWDPKNGAHKAANAYNQVQMWMIGATMSAPCAVGIDQTTWSCGLTRPGYKAIVVWNTRGDTFYTPPSEFKQYRILDGGAALPVTRAIKIGEKPLIVETSNP